MIKKLIVGLQEPSEQKLFVWNMVGSAVYAAASLILTYFTIRIVGENEGGVFAIALTLSQMFVYIAYYELRNYQVTDSKKSFQFRDYHTVKIINCIVMLVVCYGYCLLKKYDVDKLIIVMLVCFYRMLDGYADVYEAHFHYIGRLDLAGKSMTFRTILSVGCYFAILCVTHSILLAIIAACVSGIIGVYIWNIYIYDCFGKIECKFDKDKIKEILLKCFPLFLGMFLWTYLLSASRIAVDDVMPSKYQSYYQVLFLPVSVINLFAGFLIRPSLIALTKYNSEKNYVLFWKNILKIFAMLVIFTFLCIIGAYICGIPILNIIVGCDLSNYRWLFVFLIFAGGFNAIAYLLYYVLTIFRSSRIILCGYLTASIFAAIISPIMVKNKYLWGAAESYLYSIIVLLVVFLIGIVIIQIKRRK